MCLQALWKKLWYREIQYSTLEMVRIQGDKEEPAKEPESDQ